MHKLGATGEMRRGWTIPMAWARNKWKLNHNRGLGLQYHTTTN
jgi:hypothetical protein